MTPFFRTMLVGLALLGGSAEAATPAFDFPLYDTHTHLFTPDFARYPLHAANAYMGEQVLKQRIIDHPDTPEQMFALWDGNGVGAGVGVQYNAAYEADNRYVLDSARAHHDRIHAVVMLDLDDPQAAATLKAMAKRDHIVGVRMRFTRAVDGSYPWLDTPNAQAIWAMADRLQLAVVVFPPLRGEDAHGIATGLMQRLPGVSKRYPHVRIVVDHLGWPAAEGAPDYGFTAAYRALAANKQVYFKVTTVNFRALEEHGISSSDFLRHAVDLFGADHIMWGSDQGNTQVPYPQMVAAAAAAAAKLDEHERRLVFHDTGAAMFGR